MKMILTGASGFLGNYIYKGMSERYNIITISRSDANINFDLVTQIPKLPSAALVVHCAGKAHSIPKTEVEKQAFFDVNLIGTANLLKGLELASSLPKSFVFISTIAVYGCESGRMINEDHPLNATDPYGQSKIQAEKLIRDWCRENNVIYTILRLPLIVGKNPPGNLGAMIKGIRKGYYFNIAGGKARKSMVMASDIAKIIPAVADIGGIYNLTDGFHPTFDDLSGIIAKQLFKKKPLNLPFMLAKIVATIGNSLGNKSPINTLKLNKITSDLTFDDLKARKAFNWNPSSVVDSFEIS